MKDKLKNWLVPVIVVILLLLPILINYYQGKHLEVIDYELFKQNLNSGKFSLIYLGDINNENFEKVEKKLVDIRSDYDVTVYALNIKDLSKNELSELDELDEELSQSDKFIFISDEEIRKIVSLEDKDVDIAKLTNKYANNVIPDDEVAYKTLKTYKEFTKVINSKTITMHVFGRNSCSWCNKFKPVYNDVALEYKLDIYYYDSDSFNSAEYNKILNSDIKIPGTCTSTKQETPLSDGFGTPLTLFTKNGKVVGCISGYTNYSGLINKLTTVGMIK